MTGTPKGFPFGEAVAAQAATEEVCHEECAVSIRCASSRETSFVSPFGAATFPKGEGLEAIEQRVSRMEAVLLEQNGLLRELVAMLGNQRITRAQEGAIKKAVRARAEEIRIREGLPESADRMIAGEIRRTLRETTGCRAVGDIPVRVFERALAQIGAWNMAGAIRRIRRAFNG